MKKEVEDIVSKKMREGMSEGENQSTDSLNVRLGQTKEQKVEGEQPSIARLLQDLVTETKNQNKLLEKNNLTSLILNQMILVFAGISLFSALASIQISIYGENPWFSHIVFAFAGVVLIVFSIILIKNNQISWNICKIPWLIVIIIIDFIGLIASVILVVIFPQFNQPILIIMMIMYLLLCGVIGGIIYNKK